MTTFTALLLAHLLSDFPLQTNRIFRMKLQGYKGLMLHAVIHVCVTALMIRQFWQFWPTLLLLGFLHYLTDWAKLRYSGAQQTPGFVVDQGAHIVTLLFIVTLAPQMTAVFPLWFLAPAVALALVPASLTFAYVYATDRCRGQTMQNNIVKNHTLQWACTQLLPLSQKAGWFVLLMLGAIGLLLTI